MDLETIHHKIRWSLPLTVEEQRWLWNLAARLRKGAMFNIPHLEVIDPPRQRCETCDGEGKRTEQRYSTETNKVPAMVPTLVDCHDCKGTGYKKEAAQQ